MEFITKMAQRYNKVVKLLFIIFTCTVQVFLPACSVRAETKDTLTEDENNYLRDTVMQTSSMLADVFSQNYKNKEQEVKNMVLEKGYDYEMTMESFYENGNPFSSADYISYLSAYIVISQQRDRIDNLISDIDFIQMTISENTITEYEPYKADHYTDNGNGTYSKDGYYFIYEPISITEYIETSDNTYIEAGIRDLDLKETELTYASIGLTLINNKDMFRQCNLKYTEKEEEEIERISNILNRAVQDNNRMSESMMLCISTEQLNDPDIEAMLSSLQLTTEQYTLISKAVSLIGKVPYEWGGKASNGEIDKSWWSIDSSGRQKGLDCSGFVQWCFMAAGYDEADTKRMLSTTSMLHDADLLTPCTQDELEPGDLGFFNMGESVNHVGIYLGDGYYIHCSSSANTVTINKAPFKIYRKTNISPIYIDGNREIGVLSSLDTMHSDVTSNDDITLIAQTICAEAGGEGMNGWIAVAEVIKNRKQSDLYPNDIPSIVLNKKQFSSADKIPKMNPTKEMYWVAREVMQGNLSLVGADALYFRNCYTLNVEPTTDWGTHAFIKQVGNHSFYKQ